VCTNIIETGLDIPNANTIIINNANQFGLSDLHQLRGRVGRSNKKAFCYLFSPPVSTLTPEARKRLRTLEEFSDLGSGFNIAMRDLDIRGAGNLLGGEQSGFITDIGYETYQKILEEAITELKENEYRELFKEDSQVYELFDGVRLRQNCKELGFERVLLKSNKLRLYFIGNPQASYFETKTFQDLMTFITTQGAALGLSLKQTPKYFMLIKDGVQTLKETKAILDILSKQVLEGSTGAKV